MLLIKFEAFVCKSFSSLFQHNATEGKLELYKAYIAFEIKSGDPARIQCIFERAIKDNCLQHDLWISYTNYLVSYWHFYIRSINFSF